MNEEKIIYRTFIENDVTVIMPRSEKGISRTVEVRTFSFTNQFHGHICAACIGVQKPEIGDKYIGYSAIILPCNENGYLHDEFVYGKRFVPYFAYVNNNAKCRWSYNDIESLSASWGYCIRKNDKFEKSEFLTYLNELFSNQYPFGFRYCIVQTVSDTKTGCVKEAFDIASLYMQGINSLIEERINNLIEGDR